MGALFFLVVVACVPFMPAGATVPRWAILSIAAAVLMFRINISWVGGAVIGYLIIMAYVAPSGYDAAYILWHFLIVAVLFGYFVTRSIKGAMVGAALGFWVNSAVVLAQYYLDWQKIPQIIPNGGLFFNHFMASEAAAIVLAVIAGYRLWWLIPGILPTLVLGARHSMFALAVCAGVALWRYSRFAAMMATLGVLLFVVAVMKGEGGHSIIRAYWGLVPPDFLQRAGVWLDTIPQLRPWGHGLGSFIANYPAFQRHSIGLQLRFENTHNDYLQILYELGAGGAALIAVLAGRMITAPPSPAWYGMIVFAVEASFGFPLYEPASAALAAICAAGVFSGCNSLRDIFDPLRPRVRYWSQNHGLAPFHVGGADFPAHANAPIWRGVRGYPRHGA